MMSQFRQMPPALLDAQINPCKYGRKISLSVMDVDIDD